MGIEVTKNNGIKLVIQEGSQIKPVLGRAPMDIMEKAHSLDVI